MTDILREGQAIEGGDWIDYSIDSNDFPYTLPEVVQTANYTSVNSEIDIDAWLNEMISEGILFAWRIKE